MAPKKRNAFFYFMLEFKTKEENRGRKFPNGLSDVSAIASSVWGKLSKEERSKYDKTFENKKQNIVKLACSELPISYIDNCKKKEQFHEYEMQLHIDHILQDAVKNHYLDVLEFNVITFNYFVKTQDSYIPAEIGLTKFSLVQGIIQQFHQFINPIKLPLGMAYTAKNYSETTHKIIPPPNSIGEIFSYKLYNKIATFLNVKGGLETKLPPLYTLNTHVPIVQSIMQQLCDFLYYDHKTVKIYPICELFFRLKNQTSNLDTNDAEPFNSIFLVRALLERDIYDYTTNLSCDYHEEADCSKYCALSMTARWSYFIMNHCSPDLDIKLVKGKHIPANQRTIVVNKGIKIANNKKDNDVTDDEFTYNYDNTSVISETTSMLSEPNITLEPSTNIWKRKIDYLNDSSSASPITNYLMTIKNDTLNRTNPWSRNVVLPRLPKNNITINDTNYPILGTNVTKSQQSKTSKRKDFSSDSSSTSSTVWQSFNKN